MSRFWNTDALALGLAVSLLAMPSVVAADVLEIGPTGASWVAGGPEQLVPVIEAVEAAPDVSAPLTQVAHTAGPNQWQARITELSAKYDISPTLLEALVWQESRWREGAISPVGARGLAQLMPGTAREMGIDPSDPSANLEGGARYLRAQLDTFGGDIEKALAAYNAGPGRVHKAGGIPRIRETQNYVAAILGRLSEPVRR
jgi:soluble lytic murein transglycosylase-like protein